MLVYKYVHSERKDILTGGRIRFTQVDGLNDPFETNPCFCEFREWINKDLRSKLNEDDLSSFELESIIQETTDSMCRRHLDRIRKVGLVLSLTKERNNLVMWSHYADAHRGFVIGLDADHAFFSDVEPFKHTTPLSEVIYADERVRMPPPNNAAGVLTTGEYMRFFRTKSTHWAYEKEWRIFATPFSENIDGRDSNGLDMYFHEVYAECVREIIFGYLMRSETKEEISKNCRRSFPHVELFQAKLSETQFDLDIERLK